MLGSFFFTALIAASNCEESILKVRESMSTKTGVAPRREIASAVAMNVNGVVKTASDGPTPSAINAIKRASVPLEQDIAYLAPTYSANFSSNSATSGPMIYLP